MSLAPRRMIPFRSWPAPGRKPGTSTKVRIGTLKASQVRTNRAAFSDALMSRQPAKCIGWLATIPTGLPPKRAKHVMIVFAHWPFMSNHSPSSTIRRITSYMS